MAFTIIRLKPGDLQDTSDGMVVTRTPSGKWDIAGSADGGDGKSAVFAIFQAVADLDRALVMAGDWGGPRGISRIYVKGDPNA